MAPIAFFFRIFQDALVLAGILKRRRGWRRKRPVSMYTDWNVTVMQYLNRRYICLKKTQREMLSCL